MPEAGDTKKTTFFLPGIPRFPSILILWELPKGEGVVQLLEHIGRLTCLGFVSPGVGVGEVQIDVETWDWVADKEIRY